jgi:hypothetical protein
MKKTTSLFFNRIELFYCCSSMSLQGHFTVFSQKRTFVFVWLEKQHVQDHNSDIKSDHRKWFDRCSNEKKVLYSIFNAVMGLIFSVCFLENRESINDLWKIQHHRKRKNKLYKDPFNV